MLTQIKSGRGSYCPITSHFLGFVQHYKYGVIYPFLKVCNCCHKTVKVYLTFVLIFYEINKIAEKRISWFAVGKCEQNITLYLCMCIGELKNVKSQVS